VARYERLGLDSGFRFKCVRCDRCCGTGPNVSLTCFDVVRMARFTDTEWRGFIKLYVNVIVADVFPFMSIRGVGGRCPFLHEGGEGTLCVIYPARPLKCRLYPLVLAGVRPESLYLDKYCPGVGVGPLVKPPERLIKHYSWELRSHYTRLSRLVLEEGLEPLEALEELLEEAWREAEEGAEWADLDYIESLGAT